MYSSYVINIIRALCATFTNESMNLHYVRQHTVTSFFNHASYQIAAKEKISNKIAFFL